ncbi:MAG: ParB/RepB/Spo0J family partition protein [Candidatus Omnitrophica bacterium]|nr:ParB/RepB/Spo0J family partition protein [Candidatus Omnitrophota bacterium]
MEKRSLGRGIEALILSTEESTSSEKIVYIKTEQIKPNPYQPRKEFDPAELQELCASIQSKGLIQPILVRQKGEDYELIAGERRLEAAKLLNLKEIPAIIRPVNDLESLELSLIENIQRRDLNPIEEAQAFQYLIDKFGLTQEQISQVIGKSRVTVTNILRLLKLPSEIQEEIKKGRISFAQGRLLLEIEDPQQQKIIAKKIIDNSLTIRELENIISKISSPRRKRIKRFLNPYLTAVEEELQHLFGTKVKIIEGRKRGWVQIEFYSKQDLERILEIFKKLI